MLVAAQGDDEIATAAKLAAILAPPRGGSSDLGQAFSRSQGNWQQAAQQLGKRLNSRGGAPDSDKIAFLLLQLSRTGSRVGAGWDGRHELANGMGAMLDSDDALTRHEWLIAPAVAAGQPFWMRVSCWRYSRRY